MQEKSPTYLLDFLLLSFIKIFRKYTLSHTIIQAKFLFELRTCYAFWVSNLRDNIATFHHISLFFFC